MKVEGGCYCGAVRYRAEGEPIFKAMCHCRECQYISGGGANLALGMPEDGFEFIRGEPRAYTRPDLDNPTTRFFCGECGTHLLTRPEGKRNLVILKVGTLDDPAVFEKPGMAIWVSEKQGYHHVPEDIPSFGGFPPR